jgi:hypothetical protein
MKIVNDEIRVGLSNALFATGCWVGVMVTIRAQRRLK